MHRRPARRLDIWVTRAATAVALAGVVIYASTPIPLAGQVALSA